LVIARSTSATIRTRLSTILNKLPLERHRAKTLGGLLTRPASKVAAYTCGQYLNVQLLRSV
jgi:hypothetical protein